MATTYLHSVQDNPVDPAPTKIVEAFGLRKCPKLVEQVTSSNLDVRVNALGVVCEEFSNPFTIQGTMKSGLARILAKMVSDPDFLTRERASRALAMAAQHANGISAILADPPILVEILNGIKDPSDAVRGNVYDCLFYISQTSEGKDASVVAGIVFNFVDALGRDDDILKIKILKSLYNIVGSPQGLEEALEAGCIKICIELIKSNDKLLCAEAARTLGILCFADQGKTQALEGGAIPLLVTLLNDKKCDKIAKIYSTLAVMAITSTVTGRIQMHSPEAVKSLSDLMVEEDRTLRLNTLKVLCNIAVYPPIRSLLLEDVSLIKLIERIISPSEGDGDKLLEKHAKLTLEAINWKP
jgi:hypothetical protein